MLRAARENFVFLRFQRKSRLANLLSVDCVRSRAPIISRRRGKSLGNLINTKFLVQLGDGKRSVTVFRENSVLKLPYNPEFRRGAPM